MFVASNLLLSIAWKVALFLEPSIFQHQVAQNGRPKLLGHFQGYLGDWVVGDLHFGNGTVS